MSIVKKLYFIFWLLLIGWLSTTTAAAHGADNVLLVQNQLIGPYQVSIAASPATMRVGAMHFMVMVKQQRQNGALWMPALDQQVTIEVQALDTTGALVRVPTVLMAAPPMLAYETEVKLPKAGQYQIKVALVDPQSVSRTLTFVVEAQSSTFFQGMILVLLLLTGLITIWLLKEGVQVWRR